MAMMMSPCRALIRSHRQLALVLLVLAFCVKAIIPAGFMVSASPDRVLTLSVCSELTGSAQTIQITVPGAETPAGQHSPDEASDGQCAFAGLAKAATSSVDPILLALALAAILVLGFAPTHRPLVQRIPFLLPPLRGPPSAA